MNETKKVWIAVLFAISAYTILVLAWLCDSPSNEEPPLPHGVTIQTIDSCEYVFVHYNGVGHSPAVVHKGNCRNHGGNP